MRLLRYVASLYVECLRIGMYAIGLLEVMVANRLDSAPERRVANTYINLVLERCEPSLQYLDVMA